MLRRVSYALLILALVHVIYVAQSYLALETVSEAEESSRVAAWRGIAAHVPQFEKLLSFNKRSRVLAKVRDAYEIASRKAGSPVALWTFDRIEEGRIANLGRLAGDLTFGEGVFGQHYPVLRPKKGSFQTRLPKSLFSELGGFTLSLWFKVMRLPKAGGETLLLGEEDLTFGVTIVNGGGYHRQVCGYLGGGGLGFCSKGRIQEETWHQVTMSSDGKGLKLFLDGRPEGSIQIQGFPETLDGTVGSNLWERENGAEFSIAAACIWGRSLSDSEIEHLYQVPDEPEVGEAFEQRLRTTSIVAASR